VRIAHLGTKGIPSRGGTERVVEALGRELATRHEVTVYGSLLVCRSAEVDGIRVVALPAVAAKHVGPVLLQLACAAHALSQPYDIVHVHGSENAFIVPLLRLRFPVVTTNHGPAYEREKWGSVARRLIRAVEGVSVLAASAATAVAKNQAERLTARYGREVRFIPNGVNHEESIDGAGASALLAELGLEPERYWLFAAARVDPTKGCHTLLEAHARLGDRVDPLLIVGDLYHAPGYEEKLRGTARENVHFLPRLDEKPVLHGLLRMARLFVFPSRVEAMSMMLLEALALGVPTIASDIPENAQVLPHDFPLFKAGDAADLARAIDRFLSEPPDRRRQTVEEAQSWVADRYRWGPISHQYERVYAAALAAHNHP
jgi:glycosyltransferase involved in cell wall biosynthesis